MAEFTRDELRKVFEDFEVEAPKGLLGRLCSLHQESTDGLSDSVSSLKKQLKTAEKERDEALEKVPKDGETVSKAEHDKVVNELTELKNAAAAKETKAAKEKALRAYFDGKSIKDGNLDIALMACGGLMDSLELDGEKIKDTKALDDLVGGKLAGLVTTTQQQGRKTPNPKGGNHTTDDKQVVSLGAALHEKFDEKG